MSIDRRIAAALVGLVLAVAACGGSSNASPTNAPASQAAASAPAASEPAASEPAASEPAATEAPSGPEVSFQPGAAGDLEAMLPSKVGTLTFTKQSFDGASIATAGVPIDAGELDPILSANGKTVADVRMAIATAMDPTSPAIVVALQVKGLDASKLLDLMSGSSASSLTPATIGGKQVLSLGSDMGGGVVYTKGDVAFEVLLASPSNLDAIVAALP
jgi:hypothetical protein